MSLLRRRCYASYIWFYVTLCLSHYSVRVAVCQKLSGKWNLGRERARGRVAFLHGQPFVRVKIPSLYCNSGFDKNGFESIGDLWLVFLNQSCYLRLTAKVLLLWYLLKAVLAVKGLQMRPLWDNFTGGCWRQFFAHNWGWKPCTHKIRQKTRANGVVVFFSIVY